MVLLSRQDKNTLFLISFIMTDEEYKELREDEMRYEAEMDLRMEQELA